MKEFITNLYSYELFDEDDVELEEEIHSMIEDEGAKRKKKAPVIEVSSSEYD